MSELAGVAGVRGSELLPTGTLYNLRSFRFTAQRVVPSADSSKSPKPYFPTASKTAFPPAVSWPVP